MLRCTVVLFLVATLSENQVLMSHMKEFWWPRKCADKPRPPPVPRPGPGPDPQCCKTLGSNQTAFGKPCVFPFKFKGVEYNACTYENSEHLWCATEIEEDGDMMPNRYGDCDKVKNVNGESICPLTKCEAGSTWKTWDGKTCNCHDDGVAVCAATNGGDWDDTIRTICHIQLANFRARKFIELTIEHFLDNMWQFVACQACDQIVLYLM